MQHLPFEMVIARLIKLGPRNGPWIVVVGMIFLKPTRGWTVEADHEDWLWWQLRGGKAIAQSQSTLTWLRPFLGTSSKLSSKPFSASELSPLVGGTATGLPPKRGKGRRGSYGWESGAIPPPESGKFYWLDRSMSFPAGIEIAISL